MSRRMLTLLIPIVILVSGRGAGTCAAQSADEAAVRATIQAYFDGMMKGSIETLKKAFDTQAVLIGPGRSAPNRIPFESWTAGMTQAIEPAAEHRNTILSIDIAGNAAVAKTELDWPRVRYVDYLSLLKVNGEWKIVNKIWHQEPSARALAAPPVQSRPISSAELQRYIGTYQMEQGPVHVFLAVDKLMARLGDDGDGFQLHFQGDDTFIPSIDSAIRVRFTLENGKASRLSVTQDGQTMEAKRVR